VQQSAPTEDVRDFDSHAIGGAFIVAVCIEMLRMQLLGGNRYGSSVLVEPGGQRSAGFQDVAFGDRTGVLGVVVSDCVEQFVVFVE
jgi:hypothetical protein